MEVPVGLGLGTVDHVDPFHCSVRVCWLWPVPDVPTAMQNEGEVHETPVRLAAGLGTTLQVAPFHCSMRLPTATQDEAEMHEIPVRLAAGLGTIVQLAEGAAATGAWEARAPKVLAPATASRERTATDNRLATL